MRPASSIVSSFAAAAGRSLLSQRIRDRHHLLRKAKEHVVRIAKAVIDSELKSVRVIYRRTALREVVLRVAAKIWHRRLSLEEALHRCNDQRLGNVETCVAYGLVLLLGRINRQWISGGVATKRIACKATPHLPG